MIISIDFETYYDKAFSLTKLTTEEYVRSEQFEVIGVGIKVDNGPTQWFSGTFEETKTWLEQFDWVNSLALAHNAMFDAAILTWRFGIKPMGWLDTLCMARAVHGTDVGNSLAKLSEYYELGVKGTEVVAALGKRREDFSKTELEQYGGYCKNDVELTCKLFACLVEHFESVELKLIDLTVRMFAEPILELDLPILEQHLEAVKDKKQKLLDSCATELDTLMSNQKFADRLRELGVDPPMKISHTTGREAYAFAKTDEGFKELMDHPNEQVQVLVAARLGNKTTLEETRTQRFIDISKRGALPVPLKYYAARTGRWGGSDQVNLQNLPRKSPIKTALKPPSGYVLIDADSSQIEARTLAWLSGQDDLVEAFEKGEDVYKIMASKIYNKDIEEITEDERFVGKTTILGCFGADTKVLTNTGWKRIVDVQAMDMLWDGEEWVNHQGVVPQGKKEVITAYGVSATLDHEILTEHGWREWQEVGTNPSLFQSALSRANLPSSTGNNTQNQPGVRRVGNRLLDAVAVGKVGLSVTISKLSALLDATPAQRSLVRKLESVIGVMKQLFLTRSTGQGCSTELHLAYQGATHQRQECTRTMVGVGFLFTPHGEKIGQSFSNILLALMGGMTQKKKLIVSTLIKGMNQIILGLLPDQKTCLTEEKQQTCKKKLMTYDIAYAGPRNRFTVATDAGAIIVHNCGYGLGADKLHMQLKTFNKVVPVDACRRIIDVYRKTYPMIPKLWKQGDSCLEALYKDQSTTFGVQPQALSFLPMIGFDLPSRLQIRYPGLTKIDDAARFTSEYAYKTKTGLVKIYGGKVVENVCQAVARCAIGEQMLRVAKKYKVAMTVHDSIIAIAPEEEKEQAAKYVQECMKWRPKWAKTLPLNCEVKYGDSYGNTSKYTG